MCNYCSVCYILIYRVGHKSLTTLCKSQSMRRSSKGGKGLMPHSVYFKLYILKLCILHLSGSGSSVGTATGYGLDGPGIESWWG
jgi:hypothetical protein